MARQPDGRPAPRQAFPGQTPPGRDRPRAPARERHRHWWNDPYHAALSAPWWVFLLGVVVLYLVANLGFAALYLLQPGAISHVGQGDFAEAFFFSVQTMATIGYGQLVPRTAYANALVTVEALSGMLLIALTTGVVFARFSRPTARILFSRVAVIGTHDGQPTLFVRIANERRNQILQASVSMSLVRNERTREGTVMRRFHDLKLAREHTPVLNMTFLLMHPLDAASPLHGVSAAQLAAAEGEIVVTVSGLDETMSQTIHARAAYGCDEILWGHRFADILSWDADGWRRIDLGRFHETHPL